MKKSSDLLPIEDIYYLSEVLKSGMPLEAAMSLLENRRTEEIYENIKEYLKKGMPIENIIVFHMDRRVRVYFASFIRILPFSNALDLSLQFYQREKKTADDLLKEVSYPLVLMVVSLSALFVFERVGMDSILNVMKSFMADESALILIRKIIRFAVSFAYFFMILVMLGVLYCLDKKRVIVAYEQLTKFKEESLLKSLVSKELVEMLLLCLDSGFKTRETLELIRSLKHRPLLSALAYKIDENLLEGKKYSDSVTDSLFDPLLARYLTISMNTRDNRAILRNYVLLNKKKLEKKMKKISLSIQLGVYLLIGGIIVCIYQILFLPMQAIASF